VQLIFMDALDGVQVATNLHIMAHCAGLQDPALFWAAHEYIFTNASQFIGRQSNEEAILEAGELIGADKAQLEGCYADGTGQQGVEALAAIGDERGVRGRPVFDIGDQRLFGNQSYTVFAQAIEAALGE
jgi:protein-disulfide isomerase